MPAAGPTIAADRLQSRAAPRKGSVNYPCCTMLLHRLAISSAVCRAYSNDFPILRTLLRIAVNSAQCPKMFHRLSSTLLMYDDFYLRASSLLLHWLFHRWQWVPNLTYSLTEMQATQDAYLARRHRKGGDRCVRCRRETTFLGCRNAKTVPPSAADSGFPASLRPNPPHHRGQRAERRKDWTEEGERGTAMASPAASACSPTRRRNRHMKMKRQSQALIYRVTLDFFWSFLSHRFEF